VIPAVHKRGTNVDGLLRYLFGPGKCEEHVSPRLVAAWDGAGSLAAIQPPVRTSGRHDVRSLAELLEQPVRSGWNSPAQTVWHCSIRTHPTDRHLSDGQWGHIAAEVMAAVGLAPHGDAAAVRWVAVRHNDDHIHLVATLVRQDQRTAWAWKDKLHAQQVCRDLEERYGLYQVSPPGHGSRSWPSSAELNKAARLKASASTKAAAPREELRRRVRAAAALATDEADFFVRLSRDGVLVRLRYSAHTRDEVTGYSVGLDGHATAAGNTIWYGGGRLAAKLSLPRLRSQWNGVRPTSPRTAAQLAAQASAIPLDLYHQATQYVRRATDAFATAPTLAVASAIAYAAADVLAAAAEAWEGSEAGPLADAAEAFDRAARDRDRCLPAYRTAPAGHLRSMARLIASAGTPSRDKDVAIAVQLIYSIAALAESLAVLREAQNRLHQARAARQAVAHLHLWTPASTASATETQTPRLRRQPMPIEFPLTDPRRRQR